MLRLPVISFGAFGALWLAAAVLPTTRAAQPPADFSGRWTLDAPAIVSTPAVPGRPASVAAPGDMGSGWGPAITISQDTTRLSVEYTVFSRYDLQPPLTLTYPLDGSAGRNTVSMGRGEQIESSKAAWSGPALVITTTFDVVDRGAGKPFTAELVRKLSLESPATMVVEATRAGVLGGPSSTTRSVYRKAPPPGSDAQAPVTAPATAPATPPPPPTGAPFDAARVPPGLAAPKMWTAQQDHQDMKDQLGITALRPGPSGNEAAPNHANYDETLANPYPNLPGVLTLKDGKAVKNAAAWAERRKEIVEDFDREVLGRVPKNVPRVTWTVTRSADVTVGGREALGKVLIGHLDNSAYPAIDVDIQMTLVTPKDARGPVPVMIMFGGGRLLPGDPVPAGRGGPGFTPPPGSDPPAIEQLIASGWGYASLNPGSVQADNGAGLTRGIIGLVNKGQPRKPDDWGALRAWAWGASRGLDYLETEKAVDAKSVGIEGVSRYGKAALVTMAYDTRFAVVLIGSSGEGGTKLHRRNFGEAVENLTGSGEYHWMAGNFLKYGTAASSFGSRNAGDIPVDAHQLIALCAPRPTFISHGVPEKGDAKWLDHQGSFMAAIAAQPVFRLLGAKDLGRSDDDKTEKMPAVNVALLDGQLAWRQHDGGHTDGPNWKYFIPWAERFLKR